MPGPTLFMQCYRSYVLASENLEGCAATLLLELARELTWRPFTTDVSNTFASEHQGSLHQSLIC